MSNSVSILVEKLENRWISEDEEFLLEVADVTGRSVLEQSVKVANPFQIDWHQFLPQHMELPDFFDVASELIQDKQTREGITAKQQVRLTEDFQPGCLSEFGSEVITWRIMNRGPAKLNTMATAREQRSYRYHANLRSAKHPTKIIEIESRPIDHEIEFTCWATTNKEANRRVLWLEKLFIDYAYVFKLKGAERFWWKERKADSYDSPVSTTLAQRPIVFKLRLNDFRVKAHPMIRNISLEAWKD